MDKITTPLGWQVIIMPIWLLPLVILGDYFGLETVEQDTEQMETVVLVIYGEIQVIKMNLLLWVVIVLCGRFMVMTVGVGKLDMLLTPRHIEHLYFMIQMTQVILMIWLILL